MTIASKLKQCGWGALLALVVAAELALFPGVVESSEAAQVSRTVSVASVLVRAEDYGTCGTPEQWVTCAP